MTRRGCYMSHSQVEPFRPDLANKLQNSLSGSSTCLGREIDLQTYLAFFGLQGMGGSRILGCLAQSIQDGKIYMGKHCSILPALSSHQKSYLLVAKQMMSFFGLFWTFPIRLCLKILVRGKSFPTHSRTLCYVPNTARPLLSLSC